MFCGKTYFNKYMDKLINFLASPIKSIIKPIIIKGLYAKTYFNMYMNYFIKSTHLVCLTQIKSIIMYVLC